MKDPDKRRRGEQLLKEMLGEEQSTATRTAWRDISPDFEQYVVEFLSGDVWSRPQLDRKAKSLVTIAALMAMGRNRGLELNIRMATRNGVTKQEILETLLHLAPYAGFPASWEALTIADRVFKEPES